MTQLPPERNDTDSATSDWHSLLAGEQRRPAVGDQLRRAPSQPAPVDGSAPEAGRPMTRREAREAEQRRTAAIEAEQQHAAATAAAHAATAALAAVPSQTTEFDPLTAPSRSERRTVTSDPHEPEPPHRRRGAWGCLIGLVVVVALGFGAFFFLQGPITALIDRFQPAEDLRGHGHRRGGVHDPRGRHRQLDRREPRHRRHRGQYRGVHRGARRRRSDADLLPGCVPAWPSR